MAGRIRSIKPETLDDEKAASLSDGAWRLWVSMWLLADDHGRLRGGASWLRAQVFWARPEITTELVAGFLHEIEARKMAIPYDVEDQRYLAIRTWKKHQKVDHPSGPRIPFVDSISKIQELASFPRETVAKVSTALAPDPDLRSRPPIPTTDHPREGAGWLDEVFEKYPRKGLSDQQRERSATAAAALSDADRQAFTKAVTAYARRVVVEKIEPRYVTTWPVFCEGKWREYVPVEKTTSKAPSVYEFSADPPPPKDAA